MSFCLLQISLHNATVRHQSYGPMTRSQWGFITFPYINAVQPELCNIWIAFRLRCEKGSISWCVQEVKTLWKTDTFTQFFQTTKQVIQIFTDWITFSSTQTNALGAGRSRSASFSTPHLKLQFESLVCFTVQQVYVKKPLGGEGRECLFKKFQSIFHLGG